MRGGRGAKEAKDVGDVFQDAEAKVIQIGGSRGRKRAIDALLEASDFIPASGLDEKDQFALRCYIQGKIRDLGAEIPEVLKLPKP